MNTQTQAKLVLPVGKRDHIRGPETAPVTLVEYGDYECPYCGEAHGIVKQLEEMVGERLRFVFRHFPLTQIHPHAQRAAEAAEAAGTQGKFWEMHDTLFENQQTLDEVHLVAFAEQLGLDIEVFSSALQLGIYSDRVREDFMSGVRSGVNGTPTFFINGWRHDGSWQFEPLLYAVERAMEMKKAAT